MTHASHYVIRGGLEGRERLRVIGRVLRPSTMALFERVDVRPGFSCLDAGCGGGDVTFELARLIGPTGSVVGVDMDDAKLQIARAEAVQHGLANIEFRCGNACDPSTTPGVDFVYVRFLLTHLSDPASAVRAFYQQLRPGGIIAVEDIDFTGCFTYPDSPAFRRYCELYCATVTRRGGDPNIGPRLPSLLMQGGFEKIGVAAIQPIALEGESKLINPITMQNIAGAVISDGLASQHEINQITDELYAFAMDPTTVAGVPRIVQAWGRRPG